jgi:hypothetical protein
MDRRTTTHTLRSVIGAEVRKGDTLVLAETGAHTCDRFENYARTRGDGMTHVHCTDGTCYTLLDHHTYTVYSD